MKVSRVLLRQLLLDPLREQAADLKAEVLDLRERGVLRWAILAKAASCHRSNAFVEFPRRLGRQLNLLSSVLAHDSFLPKCTKLSSPTHKDTAPRQNRERESQTTNRLTKPVPAPHAHDVPRAPCLPIDLAETLENR
jgi:hypothetical protein